MLQEDCPRRVPASGLKLRVMEVEGGRGRPARVTSCQTDSLSRSGRGVWLGVWVAGWLDEEQEARRRRRKVESGKWKDER